MNIYVGNLSYDATDEDLKALFEQFGKVLSAKVISDAQTGRSRGFGFVELDVNDDGEAAVEQLNGSSFKGRPLVVNKARDKQPR